jgi:hypothetical protein
MTRMAPMTAKTGGMDALGFVIYNNLLSIPMIAALSIFTGEAGRVVAEPALRDPGFLVAAVGSALMSFLISLASMWFLSCTTATTFSLVGSLNKIPLAALGMVMFSAPTSVNNLLSILIGLVAGVVFAQAKAADARRGGAAAAGGGGGGQAGGKAGGGGGGGSGGEQLPVQADVGVLGRGNSADLRLRGDGQSHSMYVPGTPGGGSGGGGGGGAQGNASGRY